MKQRIFSGLSRRLPQPRRANNHNRLFQSPRRAWTLSLVALAATLLFGVGLLRNTRAAFATTYFVRTDGSNATCNGLTNASAASAPNCAFLTIQQAITTASAGDTINVAAGLYTQATAITVNKSLTILGAQAGVDPRPSAGTMRVIGSASEAIIDGNGLSNAFSIQASDVTIDGFDIKNATTALVDSLGASVFNNAKVRYNIIHNASTAGGAKGVRLTAMTDSTVEYNNLFVVADSGIELGAAAAGASTDALVQYNEVHDLGSAGSTNSAIYAFATGSAATAINATIRGNLVYNHFGNDAIKIGAKGGQDRLLPGGTLEDNIVHDTAQDGITIDTANTTVQRNEVYRSFSSNGAIYVEHGDNNVQVLNNYIHDNAAGLAAILVGFSGRPASPTNNVVKQNSLVNNTNNFVFFRDNTGGTATLDASGNWYGSSSQATVTASVKSSAGAVTTTNRIDFTPWLNSGTDSNSMTPGFQPDLLSLTVAPSTVSLQTGATGRLQEAVNLAATNASITMLSGTYVEDLNVNKNVTISGGGTVNGKISGTAGNFTATATLSLGDGSTTGVSMSTSLNTGGNMVTLLDSDAANLNGVTTVGSGGTLISASGLSVGGTLNGTGTVSGPTTVLNGGHVAPGLSPGVLNSDSVTFNAGSSLDVELNGTAVGSQYDQLNVTGSVTLNNPTLNLNFGFMPVFGTSFTIINNDGGDAVTGTFNGLPEGAVFVAGSVPVKISYVGGSSNDVVLTVMCAALTLNPASPLPNGTAGTPYAPVTFTASGAFGGTAAFSVVMGAPPPGMTLSPGGVLSGTPTQTGTFNFKVMATDSLGCSGMKDYALTINCQTIVINPDSPLPNGQAGVAYSQTLTANVAFGGSAAFSIVMGSLPAGLTLSSGGVLSGTPTQTGTFNFKIFALDSQGCSGMKDYALTINCQTIVINPDSPLPNGQTGVGYSQTLTANGIGTTTFSLDSGALPTGLTLSPAGVIAGTPTVANTFNFAVKAVDTNGCMNTKAYAITIGCPTLTLNSLPSGTYATPYNQTLTANPAGGGYTFSGTAPAGLTLASNGQLSGTPNAVGTFTFNLAVTGFGGACTQTLAVTLAINCPTITLTASLPGGVQGVAYNQTVTAAPAGPTYSYAVTTNVLPPGLSLNSATGALTGTPSAAGNYTFAISATAFGTCVGSQSYNMLITGTCGTVTLSPTSLPGGTLGTAYSQTITPTGGIAPYTFAVSSGSLPAGLTLTTDAGGATATLSGTPTAAATAVFTIKATSQGGCAGQRTYVLTISCGTLTLNPTTLPNSTVGAAYAQTITAAPSGPAYTYSVSLGSLPPGLSLNPATGVLSGASTAVGTYTFTIKAAVGSCSATRQYTVSITAAAAAALARNVALAQQADYDGDGKADPTLWSGDTGAWNIVRSSDQQTLTPKFGELGDVILLGDYDGDGKTDLALFRSSNGTWHVNRSSDGGSIVKAWGAATDVPVPGDYDGDGRTDIAVWRGETGTWFVLRSSDEQYEVTDWGTANAPYNDVAVPGDYDGDGKTDLAVFRRATGTWYVRRSSDGGFIVKTWGLSTDMPVPADYDGDGQTDIAVWRGSVWYIWQSSTESTRVVEWGMNAAPFNDRAMPGDYDGDGKADAVVWRPASVTWYVLCSADGSNTARQHGQSGDVPLSAFRSR